MRVELSTGRRHFTSNLNPDCVSLTLCYLVASTKKKSPLRAGMWPALGTRDEGGKLKNRREGELTKSRGKLIPGER